MSEDLTNDDLEQLLERLCLDGLEAGQWTALQSLLAGDADAQRRYVEAVHTREGLAYLLSEGPPTDNAPGSPEIDANLPPGLQRTPNNQLRAGSPPRAALAASPTARRRDGLPTWAAAASIAFIAGAALAWMAARNPSAELADAGASLRQLQPVTATPTPFLQESQLGKITGLSLEASTIGLPRSMQVGQELRCGEVVQLSAGFVRVQLHSGPQLVIKGPAEFSLVGEASVFVRSGQLTAQQGQRLTLQTPLITAECTNAEATFNAQGDDSASVYVHSGVVTLLTTPREKLASEQLRILRASDGLLVEPNGAKGVLTTAASGPSQNPALTWEDVESSLSPYQQLVLAEKPIAYWPLEKVRRNRRVLDLTQNGHDGLPIGNWPDEENNLAADRGAFFNGECYIEPDRKPPMNPRLGYTIEGWANVVGGPEFQAIFMSRWVLNSMKPDCQFYGFTLYAGDDDHWQLWTGSGVRGELWQKLITDIPVERTRWTHVIATFTPTGQEQAEFVPGEVRMYVNGQLAASGIHRASLVDFEWPARIGAAEFVPRYLTSWLFHGRLSDVALYNHPLDAATVGKHFEEGQQALPQTVSRRDACPTHLSALMAEGPSS